MKVLRQVIVVFSTDSDLYYLCSCHGFAGSGPYLSHILKVYQGLPISLELQLLFNLYVPKTVLHLAVYALVKISIGIIALFIALPASGSRRICIFNPLRRGNGFGQERLLHNIK